jgi:hypothetical protein
MLVSSIEVYVTAKGFITDQTALPSVKDGGKMIF